MLSWWRQTYSACKTTHSASAVNSGRWISCQRYIYWSTCSAVLTCRWENRHSSNALRRRPSNEPKQSTSNSGAQVHSQGRGAGIFEISCHGNSLRNRMIQIIVCQTYFTCNQQFYVKKGGRDRLSAIKEHNLQYLYFSISNISKLWILFSYL